MVNWFKGLDTKWQITVLAIVAFLIIGVVNSIFGESGEPDPPQTIANSHEPSDSLSQDTSPDASDSALINSTATPTGVPEPELLRTPQSASPKRPSEEAFTTLLGILGVSASGCDDGAYDRDQWSPSASKWTTARQATAREEGPELLGYWTGLPIASLSEADIDHHVPLKHAHLAGGCHWSESQRNAFYTDLDNLNVTTQSMNRSKSDKAPGHWDRQDEFIDTPAERCEYATQWINVKHKYELHFITSQEVAKLADMLSGCGEAQVGRTPALTSTPPTLRPTFSVATPTPTSIPPTPTVTPILPSATGPGDIKVYKNCDELRKDYPGGITKTEHPEVYAANTTRDRDKDGDACE